MVNTREVVFQALSGSVNRGLQVDGSDIDMKVFVLPSPRDLFEGKFYTPPQTVSELLDKDVRDIRKLSEMVYKANLVDLELLYSVDKVSFDPLMDEILYMRDELVKMNLNNLYRSTLGTVTQILKKYDPSNGLNKRHAFALYSLRTLQRFAKTGSFKDSLVCNESQIKVLTDIRNNKMGIETFNWFLMEHKKHLHSVSSFYSQPLNEKTKERLDYLLFYMVSDKCLSFDPYMQLNHK